MIRRCHECGREFEAKTRRALYCSHVCLKRAEHRRIRAAAEASPVTVPTGGARATVSDEDLALAIATMRGANATVSAVGAGLGSKPLAPMCERISTKVRDALDAEGL